MERKLLFIDDDAVTRIQVSSLLKKHGWQVDLATTAEEGLAAALPDDGSYCPYPIIITDLSMPDFNGVDLIRALRDNSGDHQPKIIVLSGDVHAADRHTFKLTKPDAIIDKPFDPQTCLNLVEKLYNKTSDS